MKGLLAAICCVLVLPGRAQLSIGGDSLMDALNAMPDDSVKLAAVLRASHELAETDQTAATQLAYFAFTVMERIEWKRRMEEEEVEARNRFLAVSVGATVLLLLLGGLWLQRNRIAAEKRRSEELLLNILPEEVANELKAVGSSAAREFEQVTILFSDFKDFTGIAEQLTPTELVDELNTCFRAFDRIITARGIEKIKTIGDAYMCAGGIPDPLSATPADVVLAALEMQAFMRTHADERRSMGRPLFEMRVGIHTGPVVAGIVGVKKFQYDIWGDTVNTASRMESSSEVGRVNISEATYALVKDVMMVNGEWSMANGGSSHSPAPIHRSPAFVFTPRGKVQAKGKGELGMYFVEHHHAQRPEGQVEDGIRNEGRSHA